MTRILAIAILLAAAFAQACGGSGNGGKAGGSGTDSATGASSTSAGSGAASGSDSGAASGSGTSTGSGGASSTGTVSGAGYDSATTTTATGVGGTGAVGSIASTTSSSTTGASYPSDVAVDQGAAGAAGASSEVYATNPFVVAEHDPLSTFAADVDTASYDTFRSYALSGALPDSSRVRLEEFVNYFDYDYPAPASDAELPFEIALDAASSPFGTGTTLLRVGIQGKARPPLERKPTNLVFLVDVSGSMQSADKLPLVKQVLTQTVDILNDEDTISIVTYASGTEVRLPPTPTSESDVIVSAIEGLSAGGSTAGAAGLDLAYQQAEAGFIEDGLNHVILCTDGDFNVGPSSTAELVDLITEKRKSGVTLTVLGFGMGNNDSLMEAISNAGNGVYGNITDSDQATRYVEERMLATLEQIAQDVKLQVEFNPEQVSAYRLLGYEDRAIADQDFRDDTVDAGEIASGHRVTALYELALVGGAIPEGLNAPMTEDGPAYSGPVEVDGNDWVLVKVRYKEPGSSDQDPAFEVSRSLSSDDLLSALNSADADFRWAVAVAGVAELLKQSPYAPSAHLTTIEELINDAAYADDPDKVEFATLFANISSQL